MSLCRRFGAAVRAASLVTALTLPRLGFAVEVEETNDPTQIVGKLDYHGGPRLAQPDIAPASGDAAEALERMKLPPGLTASVWAAEPMLANPVAINFDEKGRLFVTETYRYESSTLDIRRYLWMLEDDLASRSIADRTAQTLQHFGPEGVKELSVEGEVLRLLEDTKHTGVADRSTIYADGFRSPLDGIASGVLARRGEVWFTNIPSLWKFTGENHAETRTELSRGYGIRFSFTGHDLHGLIFGPDGKIYFSVGDRGAHATAIDGSVADSLDTGSVFRCNPDGTQLEVVASGLRNPQDLAFTENGDLLTGDNDFDHGDEERLVQVVEGGDSGWRIGYQHPPLGYSGTSWLAEKLWLPHSATQPAYIVPPICNIEDGPSGIAYYPGTGLNPSYAGNLFVTHFKGSVATSGIYTYKVKPAGATYAIADCKPFLTSALPTDVKFGPDGRLYYSDWAEGWPKSKRGRIYAISDPARVNDPLVKETQALIASDYTRKSADDLRALLAHPDWRVRLEAQFTLAERGAGGLPVLAAVAANPASAPLARLHALWGLGQLAGKYPAALAAIRPLITDPDSEVRAQSLKLLGDHGAAEMSAALIAALKDDNNRVKFFAAQSLGKLRIGSAAPALLEALRANLTDTYLRHSLVMGLVGGGNLGALQAASRDRSPEVRLGVLLAFRRLGRPEIAEFLSDPDPFIRREAVLAINDAPIVAAYPALAALIEHPPTDERVMLRVLNAQFRLGQAANAAALAAYAVRTDMPEGLRAEALQQLALWPHPPQRDRIVGIYRPLAEKTRDAAVAANVLLPALPVLLDRRSPESVQEAAIKVVGGLGLTGAADPLLAMVGDPNRSIPVRIAALNTLDGLHSQQVDAAVKLAGDSSSSELRLAALAVAARLSPATAAPVLGKLAAEGNAQEKRAAFTALGTLKDPAADRLLLEQLEKLATGEVPPSAQLELVTAAGLRDDPDIKAFLIKRDVAQLRSADALAPYRIALEGGNVKSGLNIFRTQPVMACVRCHRIGNEAGGEAGPNLAGVGKRYSREYLLESIVKPNAKIAPGFDTVVVTLKGGGVAAGVVVSETAAMLKLRDTDNHLHEVQKADIAKRESAPSGMPEVFGFILTKSDLRDLVQFLASLKSEPKKVERLQPRALRGLQASQ